MCLRNVFQIHFYAASQMCYKNKTFLCPTQTPAPSGERHFPPGVTVRTNKSRLFWHFHRKCCLLSQGKAKTCQRLNRKCCLLSQGKAKTCQRLRNKRKEKYVVKLSSLKLKNSMTRILIFFYH